MNDYVEIKYKIVKTRETIKVKNFPNHSSSTLVPFLKRQKTMKRILAFNHLHRSIS